MKLELNREFALRHLGVAALMLALALWFGFDGFVRYPQLPAHDIYVSIEKSEPSANVDLEAFKRQKIQTQYGFTALCFLASLLIALGVLVNRRRTLAWDDEKMEGSLTGGRPLAFSDVVGVEDAQWERKGILVLLARDGRRVKLDAWHHVGVKELVARLLPGLKNKVGLLALCCLAAGAAFGARTAPWTKERAWAWYRAQPWIRGCNYMPASAANRVDQWQQLGKEERFAEVEREFALAEKVGLNALRIIVETQGFGVWLAEHDGFMANFERYLAMMQRHGLRAIVVLGNDCSRPKEIWQMPKPGVQAYDLGYHGGRRVTQHGSNPKAVGYTVLDDPQLRPKFYAMCEELLAKYRDDDRILFWNLWNEPGNNNRNDLTMKDLRELFERAWRIDPKQPLAADIWTARGKGEGRFPVERLAGELSDIVSYHCYADYRMQKRTIDALRARWGRPMVNTEWLARIAGDELATSYPLFAQEDVGCTCWGFVNGKYQTHEPYEPMWKTQFEYRHPDQPVTKWYHDLFRPSHHPYDPVEINILMNVNAQMDAARAGTDLRAKIAKRFRIVGEEMWYGFRRTRFDFNGRVGWIVQPSVKPAAGRPWTWTMQWAEAYVERTGVLDLLKKGYHHVTLDLFATRMDETGLAAAADFQKFLVDELGFAPQANLVGMSWGGFFSTRYANAHPANVRRIYLDAPLLNFQGFAADPGRIGPWAARVPKDGAWENDPQMPVNMAPAIAKAGIPILLLYGGQDQSVPPAKNCELFAARFKAAGGKIDVQKRGMFGHHPHGVDPDKTALVQQFFQSK